MTRAPIGNDEAPGSFHDTRSLVPQYQRLRRSWVAAGQDGVVQRADAGCCDPDEYPPISPARSFRPPHPVNDSARMVRIMISPLVGLRGVKATPRFSSNSRTSP